MSGITYQYKEEKIPPELIVELGRLTLHSAWLDSSLKMILDILTGQTPNPRGSKHDDASRAQLEKEISKLLVDEGYDWHGRFSAVRSEWEELLSRLKLQRDDRNAMLHDLVVHCIEADGPVIIRTREREREGVTCHFV